MGVELFEPTQQRIRDLVGFPIVDADVAVGANINANKIGTGVVDNTEFNRLNGITSAIEEQGNKGAVSGYAGLDASQELLLTNFPSGNALEVLRRDAGNTALEFAAAGAGSQTPWVSDIDADGFDLNDLSNILFRNSTGVPTATDRSIHYNDAEGMVFNALTGDVFRFEINAVLELLLNSTELNLQNNKLANVNPTTITDFTTVTAVSGDFIWIIDATDGLSKKANASDFLGGASQTPWLTNIDADGFDLNDLSNILFRTTTGAPGATDRSIHYDDTTGMEFNALTGDVFLFQVNNVTEYEFNATAADFNSNNVVNMGTINTHTVPGGTSTFALFSDNLSVFAATTSLQLLGVISDETGTGLLVFNDTPTLITPTIGDFTNAQHGHTNPAGGGQITEASISNLQSYWLDASTNTGTNKTLNSFTNDISADEVHLEVRNESGFTINKGEAVHISGYSIGSDLPLVTLADADGSGTMPAVGLVESATIANNANGDVLVSGRLSGINTVAFSAGDIAYITTTPGALGTKPTGATALIQSMGEILRSHATLGVIEVQGAGRVNDLPNIADGDMWIGNASDVPIAVTMSGDVTISNAGVTTIGALKVTNGMLAGSIAASKLIGTDIDTVGTITTGVWNGTAIDIANLDPNVVVDNATSTFTSNQIFNDNVKTFFGTGSDFAIYYDGTNTFLSHEVGSGVTRILMTNATAQLELEANHTTPTDGQNIGLISFLDDDNLGSRAEYGRIQILIQDPTSTTKEAEMFLSVVDSNALTHYIILNEAADNHINFRKNTHFDDSIRALFGTGSDAAIYYNGTNLIIDPRENGTGNLLLNAGNFDINGNQIINTGTLTLPTSTDTLMGRATTDTMTGKSYALGGTGNALTGTAAEFDTAVTDDNFMFDGATNVVTGAIQITGGTMRIPLSATPTMAVNGDFAIDTTIADFTTPLIRYFGTESMVVVAVPTAEIVTPSGGFVVAYNATNDEFELVAQSGGSQTPWVADIDSAGFDLGSLSNIVFQSTTGAPGATDRSIHYEDTTGMEFNALTGDVFLFQVNNVTEYQFTASQADFNSNNVINMGTLNTHTIPGGTSTFAIYTDKLDVFAATSSLEFIGVISDETGTGLLVFNDTPTIITPTIASFTNATHDHVDAAGGGQLTSGAMSDLPWTIDNAEVSATLGANLIFADFDMSAKPAGSTDFFNLLIEIIAGDDSGTEPMYHINLRRDTPGAVVTRNLFEISNNDVAQLTMLNNGNVDFEGNDLTNINDITSITSINGVAIGNYLLTTDQPFAIDGAAVGRTVSGGSLVLGANALEFNTATESISIQTGDMIFDVPTTDFFSFDIAGTPEVTITDAEMNLQNNKLANVNPTTITAFSTVTAAAGDFIWIIDAGDGLSKKADASDFLGGGAQTPWASTIDAADFSLTNLDILDFNTVTDTPAIAAAQIWWNSASSMFFNVPTGDSFDFTVNGVSQMLVNVSTIDFQGNTLTDILDITSITSLNGVAIGNYILTTDNSTDLADTANIAYLNTPNVYIAGNKQSFVADATNPGININNQVPSTTVGGDLWRATDNLTYRNNADTADIIISTDTNTLTLLNKTLTTPTIGDFTNATHDHEDAAGGAQLDSTLALSDTANIAYLNTSNTYATNTIQTFTPDASNGGINVGSFAGEPTGANGELVYDSTANQMKGFVNGAWVNLGQSGSEVFTWTADHNMDTFSLITSTSQTDAKINLANGQTIGFANDTDSATRTVIYENASNNFIFENASTQLVARWDTYSSGPSGTAFSMRHARGTKGAEAATSINDFLLSLAGHGWGTSFSPSGRIDFKANENYSGTAKGARMEFSTVDDGTTTLDINLTLEHDGTLSFEKTGIGINFLVDGHTIIPNATALTFDLSAATDDYIFQTNAVTRLTISDTIVNTASGVVFQENTVPISPIGIHDDYYDAGNFIEVTAGTPATRTIGSGDNRKGVLYIPFVNGAVEFATIKLIPPRNWDASVAITVVVHWTSAVEGAGTVEWDIAGVAVADGDDLTAAATNYGTLQTATDTQTTIDQQQISPRTSAITLANTPTAGDAVYLRFGRDGVTDTFDQPAQLLGISVAWTIDGAVAA